MMEVLGNVSNTSSARTHLDIEAAFPNGHGFLTLTRVVTRDTQAAVAEYQRIRAEASTRLSPTQLEHVGNFAAATVFPNFSILCSQSWITMRVWQPIAYNKTQVWSWTLVEANASDEIILSERQRFTTTFSSSGMFEQDDGLLWSTSQRTLEAGTIRRRFPIPYLQGAAAESAHHDPDRPGKLGIAPTEMTLLNFYKQWSSDMGSAS
jgi:hypothetical protein